MQEPEYNDMYETRGGSMRGKSCPPSFHYILAKVVHHGLTKGEMERGSFKDRFSHGVTHLALLVVGGIIASKHKWKLMSFLIKVSCLYLMKHKTMLCQFLWLPSVMVNVVLCNCTPSYVVIGNINKSSLVAKQHNQGN